MLLRHVAKCCPNMKKAKCYENFRFQANLEPSLIAFPSTARHLHFHPNQNPGAAGLSKILLLPNFFWGKNLSEKSYGINIENLPTNKILICQILQVSVSGRIGFSGVWKLVKVSPHSSPSFRNYLQYLTIIIFTFTFINDFLKVCVTFHEAIYSSSPHG